MQLFPACFSVVQIASFSYDSLWANELLTSRCVSVCACVFMSFYLPFAGSDLHDLVSPVLSATVVCNQAKNCAFRYSVRVFFHLSQEDQSDVQCVGWRSEKFVLSCVCICSVVMCLPTFCSSVNRTLLGRWDTNGCRRNKEEERKIEERRRKLEEDDDLDNDKNETKGFVTVVCDCSDHTHFALQLVRIAENYKLHHVLVIIILSVNNYIYRLTQTE